VRLRRSDLQRPGLSRRRRGAGWSYLDVDGHLVDGETRQRISSLAIPPAWQDVWISPYPNGHIQAVGTDVAGRRQYLYHEQWRLTRDELKHARVLTLARRLPKVREAIGIDLVRPQLDRDRVLATALRMLDYGLFRSGNESYTEDNGSHGVATLLREHVIARRDQVAFDFPAKSGVARSLTLIDAPLAEAVRALRRARTGTDRLLVYRCEGGWGEVHADTVNQRFKELAGADFTVKDLRTWRATVVAAMEFSRLDHPTTRAARTRAERTVMEAVAQELGNTPAVARSSYVDPRVVETFGRGQTIARALSRIGTDDLTDPAVRLAVERAVIRLLRR
jgi:DNA topoisomerase-1